MVDFQLNFDEWQDTATFFPSEPVDNSFNFDEFLGNGKTNNEVGQTIPSLPDLEWFDEKVDLSFVDDPYSMLTHPNETEALMVEDAAALLGLMDSNLDTSSLSSHIPLNGFNDLLKKLDVSSIQNDAASSEYSESHLASPGCTSLQINSPQFFESPVNSPASSTSELPLEYVPVERVQSPAESVSSWSMLSGNTNDYQPIEVSVTVCEPTEFSQEVQEAASIEEISNSVKQRKYVSNGKEIPKIVLKNSFRPYSKGQTKVKERRERKKVQNKEAAARYREKKRMEEKELSDEVTTLQLEQKKLQDTHDKLHSEIKYLKSLMCEILQKKGVIK